MLLDLAVLALGLSVLLFGLSALLVGLDVILVGLAAILFGLRAIWRRLAKVIMLLGLACSFVAFSFSGTLQEAWRDLGDRPKLYFASWGKSLF